MAKKHYEEDDKDLGRLDVNELISGMEQAYSEGCKLFDAQDFMGAQHALVDAWLQEFSGDRFFYEGLVNLSAAFFEFELQKFDKSRHFLQKTVLKLERYRPRHLQVDVDQICRSVEAWQTYIDQCIAQNQVIEPQPAFPRLGNTAMKLNAES